MLLERKAWHRVVRLMRKIRPPYAPLGGGPEGRQVRAPGQMMDERSGEDGLARAGKTRDTEAEGRLDQLAGGLPE